MLERLSVREPFTVLVAVILIIVLGAVSFVNTTTDLLPGMNLPYAAVMTAYAGKTPEQVEADITAPIESRMGTVSGISRITSVSNEHYSVVILQFADSTDMDSASLEIRESLDRMTLPDGAGKPSVLKLNPDMMPVMVAAVYMKDAEPGEISVLVRDTVAPSLEGVAGVASATASGLIQNGLHVVLNSEKIDKTNENLQKAVQRQIDEALAETERQVEEAVSSQVAEYVKNRTAELMTEGMSQEEAGAQVRRELPAVTEQITQAVLEAVSAGAQDRAAGTAEIGIPSEMLTVDAVTAVLSAQNFSMPAGTMSGESTEYMVRVGDRFTGAAEISSMLLFDTGIEGMEPIVLSDIADIFVTDDSDTQYTRVNGSPAVMITMQKQTEFSTSDLTDRIRERMDELSEKYEGLEFVILMDQGQYIDIIIDSVINNLLVGGVLAIAILLIFLKDIRPTLVVGISIPVSLLLAFTAMYFTGVSLNIISMSGLALGVGMLVDNSIVVIENIYRLKSEGAASKRAAAEGAKQVAGAIAASTLTTISVFFPIVFVEGITRQLFADLALTIAYSLIASLLVALTVVPAASSALFRNVKSKEGKLFVRFQNIYASLLERALRFKWGVLIFSAMAFGISIWGIILKGTEFIPAMDTSQIMVDVTMPEGASFEEAVSAAETLSGRMEEIQDIQYVGVTVGGDSVMGGLTGGSSSGTNISMYVLLDEDRAVTNDEIASLISALGEDLDCDVSVSGGMGDSISLLTGDGVSVRIFGQELDNIRDTATEVADIVRSVEGTVDVSDGFQNSAPELRVRVDKDSAMRNGLTVAQVFMTVNKFLTNPEQSVSMTIDGGEYNVLIKDGDWEKPQTESLKNLKMETGGSQAVTLSDIAEIYEDTGFDVINRMDNTRYVTVSGTIAEGYNVGLVNAEIERRLSDYIPKDGCYAEIGGESESIAQSFNDLYLMLLLALIFIYLIMVAQFRSLLSPFIVMFTIPLAFTGGFAGLLIAGMPLSVVGMIGLILLSGVVVNNGIVFIDCVNQLRREGTGKKQAVTEAGRIRVRPILMTALTTIVAMSTMTVGMGQGTEMVQPMAVTTVGGLIYATLMTLFVVPVLYDIFHKDKDISKDDDLDYDFDHTAQRR